MHFFKLCKHYPCVSLTTFSVCISHSCHSLFLCDSFVFILHIIGLDLDNYKSSLVTRFGPGSGYDIDRSGEKPVLGPWLNGSLKQFLANHEEKKAKTGADSADVSIHKTGPNFIEC